MEAFALAMVLYSGGMKEAMLAGIGLILGDVLLHVLQDNFRDKYQRAFSGMGILVTVAVLTYCWDMTGLPVDVKTLLGFGAMVLLLGKQHDDLEKAGADVVPDYNRILWADSVAYGFWYFSPWFENLCPVAVCSKWSLQSGAFCPMLTVLPCLL